MPTCTGDCNQNSVVAVNELIICVLMALGSQSVDDCPPCDVNRDARVTIHELIAGVAYSTGQSICPHVDPFSSCGDTIVQDREDCDDGNTVGGDDCAANCTQESVRRGTFDAERSRLTWPIGDLAVVAALSGGLTLRTGQKHDLLDAESPFEIDDVPVVILAGELNVDPVVLPGLGCLCLRALAAEPSAVEVAGSGVIHCSGTFQWPIDYRAEADGQIVWSERAVPSGSGVIHTGLSITLLSDAGTCSQRGPGPDDGCAFPDYGADCLPCTPDDVVAPPTDIALTTGMVTVAGGDGICTNPPCDDQHETGTPFDCDLLDLSPTEGISGAALAFGSQSDAGPLLGILTFD